MIFQCSTPLRKINKYWNNLVVRLNLTHSTRLKLVVQKTSQDSDSIMLDFFRFNPIPIITIRKKPLHFRHYAETLSLSENKHFSIEWKTHVHTARKKREALFTRSFGWINTSERPKSLQQQQLRNCGMWYSVFMFKMVEIDKASYYLPSHQVTFLECVFFFSA